MSISSRSTRLAYLIHGLLSLLVVGILGWTTIASLRLERTQRQIDLRKEHESKIRSAMYQMENWANPLLFSEFQRGYADYSALYRPDTEQVRFVTGEMLAPGSIVQPSPLLVSPPQHDWILLYFQASPRSGYRSPQIMPDKVRFWPAFEDAYDTWNRAPFASMLASLEYAYTIDELTCKYEEAHGGTHEDASDDVLVGSPPNQSDYARQRINTAIVQRAQTPPVRCTPQQLAAANIHAPADIGETPLTNEGVTIDDLVGVQCQKMLPTWLKFANRSSPDLAFLRTVYAGGETALQGFIIDWSRFKHELLAKVHYLFPDASIEIINTLRSTPQGDTVFGFIPARLVTNAPEPVIAGTMWNTTHSFLLVGWAVSFILLVAAGFGIRSLVSLSERRSQFAYAVTHELRTPLTTFRLYTDMLAQGMVAEQNKQEYLDTLNNESRRLADLVSGVLEYSRIENNSVPINKEAVSIGAILEAVRGNCGPRCEGAAVHLQIDEGDVANDVIQTDRQHVVQIIGNLVDNACKYGRNGDHSTVRVSVNRTHGAYQFDVIDEGQGVPARLRSSIFKPYQRGDNDSAPATGGIGLGLALSRSWAKLLGGYLELIPTLQGACGARFRFTLPAGN